MLGIAPIVYPSIRRGGPGGADLMVIDQSRAMSATLPSKRTGDAFKAVVMPPDCPFWSHRDRSGLHPDHALSEMVAPVPSGRNSREQRPPGTAPLIRQFRTVGSVLGGLHDGVRPSGTWPAQPGSGGLETGHGRWTANANLGDKPANFR